MLQPQNLRLQDTKPAHFVLQPQNLRLQFTKSARLNKGGTNLSLLHSIGRWAIGGSRRLIAPGSAECAVCESPITEAVGELPVCRRCGRDIPWIAPSDIRCRTCGRYEDCPDCPRRVDTPFVCNRSAVRYNEAMKSWLSRFKYRGDERLQSLMAGMTGGALERLLSEYGLSGRKKQRQVFLTYVPLSPARQAERGFNQTELIACKLGMRYKLPVIPTLTRVRHTEKQSYKTRAERLGDLTGAFETVPSLAPLLSVADSPHIILIDDVYTTGSTLGECARTIRGDVDAHVYGLCWAR